MKSILISFLLLTAFNRNDQISILGVWDTGKDNTKIEITEENGVFKGIVISSDHANQQVRTLLKEVKLEGSEWKGLLFVPKQGEWFDVVITKKDNKLLIKVKKGFMSKTLEWNKV
ncbi:MAG: hypothetical protein SFU91_14945 [Chloroherpetonaceae bacterium]|nr:hypothetical protein [Chloroherpetonaceae bacterium]